jgi:hypothetical protein
LIPRPKGVYFLSGILRASRFRSLKVLSVFRCGVWVRMGGWTGTKIRVVLSCLFVVLVARDGVDWSWGNVGMLVYRNS